MRKSTFLSGLALAAGLSLSNSPAHATGTVECTATDGSGAEAFLLVGRLPFLALLRGQFSAGGVDYTTEPASGAETIVFAQGYQDDHNLLAEFSDPNAERIVISLRTVRDSGDKTSAEAGVLTVEGTDVYAVSCEQG